MSVHFKEVCRRCSCIVSQCGCMTCDKIIEFVVCDTCTKEINKKEGE